MATQSIPTLIDRFLRNVSPEPNTGCWFWTGQMTKNGYGRFRVQENMRKTFGLAHIFSYRAYKGPIPKGMEIGHKCHDSCGDCAGGSSCPHRSCVNPDHLEAMTHKENLRRGRGPMPGALAGAVIQKAKTHCPRGHEYTPENLYQTAKMRRCRTCDRIRARVKHRKLKGSHLSTTFDTQELRIYPLSSRKLVVYEL